MLAAALLGIRLSVAGGPRRPSSLALASAIGAYLLAGALELPGSLLPPDQVSRQDRLVSVATVIAVIVVPAGLLLLAVNRLSAGLRDTRLARLRLLGLPAGRVRLVAAGENTAFGVVGALIGVGVYATTAARSSQWLIDRGVPLFIPLQGRPAHLATVVLAVALLSTLVAMAPHRAIRDSGLVHRAEGARPAPSAWRLLPLAAGLALTAYVLTRDLSTDRPVPPPVVVAFLGGTVLTGVGIVLALAPIMAWAVSALLRLPLGVSTLLAARRQQSEPTSVVRLLSGLVLATFVTAFAMGPVAAFEGTTQYAAASQIAEEGPALAMLGGEDVGTETAVRELTAIPGVVAVWRTVETELTGCGFTCPTPVVAECPSVVAVLGPGSCSTTEPIVARLDESTAPVVTFGIRGSAGTRTIRARAVDVTPSDAVAWQASLPLLILPPTMAQDLGLTASPGQVQVWHDATGRTDAPLARWARGRGGAEVFEGWQSEFDQLHRIRFLVRLLGAVVLGLGLLVVLIAAVDRVVERRRVVASLLAVGAPRRTLVLAQLTQSVLGIVPAVVLAVGCGMACAAAYLHFGQVDPEYTPWGSWSVVGVVALVGSVVVALATTAGVGARLTPEALRRE